MTTVALATCSKYPALYADDVPLVLALARLGIRALPAVWNAAPPGDADALIVRSVWDYHLHAAEFLAWVERMSATRPFWNDPALIRWNAHKTYLRDLAGRGVAAVPTLWADATHQLNLAAELGARGWRDVVVTPAVSASAHRTARFGAHDHGAAQRHCDDLARDGVAMVQPYLASVEGYGERSFFFIDGAYTHAVRRQAVLTQGFEAERPAPLVDPTAAEMALCHATLAALEVAPLYARVDVAPDDVGTPRLMELELIEPRLYFRENPAAAERLAAAIARRLGS
jgi:glutathione synthase/RimK-type ligase-like ATP-grasp enzyme